MKKIIIEKTPTNKFITGRLNKFIMQWLKKEYPFKELETDKETVFKECSKLVSTFAEIIFSYKKENKDYTFKTADNLCKKFAFVFYELINSTHIDTTIKAMITFTWDHVIRKYLKEAIKLSDFLGSQIAIILLGAVNVEVEKIGVN
jgi:hypothetical protein